MVSQYPSGLTCKQVQILKNIFVYRALRAKDICVFLYKSKNYSLSEEKSVYNYLSKLKQDGLIKSFKLQEVESLGSLYYLTARGLEIMKGFLNIEIGQNGNGLLPISENSSFWDIPMDYQIPPFKQSGHFLATIDFYKELVADQVEAFIHSTNHYSNLIYYKEQKLFKVKPDSTVFINGNRYAIEIDRVSESQEQLYQKFVKYKEHNEYCQRVEDKSKTQPVHTILFVVESRTRKHGIQRRWVNVLSAFYRAFGENFPDINLLFVTMDEVAKTLTYEIYRKQFEMEAFDSLHQTFEEQGFSITTKVKEGYHLATNQELKNSKLLVLQIHHEFESRIFKDKFDFYKITKLCREKMHETPMKDFSYEGATGYWWSPYNTPKFPVGIEKTQLKQDFLMKLKVAENIYELYKGNRFDTYLKELEEEKNDAE